MEGGLQTRRVLISAPGLKEAEETYQEHEFVTLLHPQSGQPTVFVVQGEVLQEVNLYRPSFGSWFADNTVISDGGLFLCTPVDPVFLAIPLLQSCNRRAIESDEGVFQAAEEVFRSGDCAGCARLMPIAQRHLPLICDLRDVEGTTYYRLNPVKVEAWLVCKVRRTAAALRETGRGFGSMDARGLEQYAVGVLGEYLSAAWLARLKARFKVDDQAAQARPLADCNQGGGNEHTAAQHIEKKIKLDQKAIARRKSQEVREEKKLAQLKRETAGMKKMNSFFKPRPPSAA